MSGNDEELLRQAMEQERIFERDWMPRIRMRFPDAVQLSPDNPELHDLLEAGILTLPQLENALIRGAVAYSPSRNTFVDLKPASPGEAPTLPDFA